MNPQTRARLSRPFLDILDLIYPRSCVHCGEAVEEASLPHFCGPCSRRVRWVGSPACSVCGYPFFGEMEADRECPHCLLLRPVFRSGRTAVLVRGPVRELVHGIKYRGERHLWRDVRAVLERAGELREFFSGAVLVPVPLHPRKQRERGFNQSLVLAEIMASLECGTSVEELLVRTVDTLSQTRFDRGDRMRNLKNAFAISRKFSFSWHKRYVLVDDVFTTGSTLNACASVLGRAGVKMVDVATFGHG